MGQFKPMVKMMTTEPTVELKLKKGGHVMSKAKAKEMAGHKPMCKADGGMMEDFEGMGEPVIATAMQSRPSASPGKPSMGDRMRSMKGQKMGNVVAPAVKRAVEVANKAMQQMRPAPKNKPAVMPAASKPFMSKEVDTRVPNLENQKSTGKPTPMPIFGPMPEMSAEEKAAAASEVKGKEDAASKAGPYVPPPGFEMPFRSKSSEMAQTQRMKKGGKAHEDVAQDRAMIKKAMAGKKFATGGVVMGQGGFKTGGVIKGNKGGYAKGGGVEGNVSGTPAGVTNTKTGGVRLGNAGGFKKGGATKKFADGGAVQDDGRAVKMPQGNKRPSTPVSINRLSGTFKKGGKVGGYAEGGDAQTEKNEKGYKQYEAEEKKFNESLRQDMGDVLTYPFRKIKDLFSDRPAPKGSVTKTKESVTVAKKSGGKC